MAVREASKSPCPCRILCDAVSVLEEKERTGKVTNKHRFCMKRAESQTLS